METQTPDSSPPQNEILKVKSIIDQADKLLEEGDSAAIRATLENWIRFVIGRFRNPRYRMIIDTLIEQAEHLVAWLSKYDKSALNQIGEKLRSSLRPLTEEQQRKAHEAFAQDPPKKN